MAPEKGPPRLLLRLFRWYCDPKLADHIEGDLIEDYFARLRRSGKKKAQLRLVIDVLLLFRPGIVKPLRNRPSRINKYDMFRHNLLIAFRNFLRFKSSFIINLTGLSSGLACALLIYLWVDDELSVDKFHENRDRLYQVMENVEQDGGLITRITTAGPTADALASEMPEVEYAVTNTFSRIFREVLSVDGNDVKGDGLYASTDFFKVFSFELIEGDRDIALSDKNSIVITENLAMQLFGTTENIVGRSVSWQHKKEFLVSGLLKDIPHRSSVKFDFILTFDVLTELNASLLSWYNTAPQTFVLLKEGTDVAAFNKKIAELVRIKTDGNAKHRTPFITRYTDTYLYGKYENGKQAGGRIEYVKLFLIIGVFIVLIACINFMNLSTARASRRTREVGIKKVVGARKGSLVVQYLSESILISFISLLLAIALVITFLPQFNSIVGKNLRFRIDLDFGLVLLGIILITGLVAGSYPAFYLSKFKPVTVLKGRFSNLMGEARARKALVAFQFTLSVILIVSVWVVNNQIQFIQTKNPGFNKDNVIVMAGEGIPNEKRETFLSEIRNLPGVAGASSTGHDMTGHNSGTYGIEWPGKSPENATEFENIAVNHGLIEALGISIKEGRSFSREFADSSSIIFNEAAIKFMELKDPVGKEVKLWGKPVRIIGVAKDFHFETFHEEIKPAFFRLYPEAPNIMIKIETGHEQDVLARLETLHAAFGPGFPLDFYFLDADYQALYVAETRVSKLSRYFAGLAVLISCLGLYGLAAFTAERRVKEIGIRKVLGSSEFGIVYLLSGEFTGVVLLSTVIALPASYFVVREWLERFAFRIELEWWYFLGSGILALLISLLTVGTQALRAAKSNPVVNLRSE